MKSLSNKQRIVVEFISNLLKEELRTPTLMEISSHLEVNSSNAASSHIKALKRKGWLENRSKIIFTEEAKSKLFLVFVDDDHLKIASDIISGCVDLIKDGTGDIPVEMHSGAEYILFKLKAILLQRTGGCNE